MRNRHLAWGALATAAFLVAGRAGALDVGDTLPAFKGTDDHGNPWSSTDHVGKGMLAVFFYPAAMTGG